MCLLFGAKLERQTLRLLAEQILATGTVAKVRRKRDRVQSKIYVEIGGSEEDVARTHLALVNKLAGLYLGRWDKRLFPTASTSVCSSLEIPSLELGAVGA